MHRLVKVISFALCVILVLTACAKNEHSAGAAPATDESESTTEMTILAEPVDMQLDLILGEIHENVFPGTAGSTLSAVPHCISLLNWCETTSMMDDEILYLVLTYMYELPAEEFELFQSQMDLMFHTQLQLSGEHPEGLLESAGVSGQISWSPMAVQHFYSIMDAAGVDVYNYQFTNQ